MLFSPNSILSMAIGLMISRVCHAMPPSYATDTPTPTATLPATCYTTVDDFPDTTGWVESPSCYTYTVTKPSDSCPSCTRNPSQVCPLIIRVTTIEVPCSTDCCPQTPTAYVDAPCSTCVACPIPTQTITQTTGCTGSSSPSMTGYPTVMAA